MNRVLLVIGTIFLFIFVLVIAGILALFIFSGVSLDQGEVLKNSKIDLEIEQVQLLNDSSSMISIKRNAGESKKEIVGLNIIFEDGKNTEIIEKNFSLEELKMEELEISTSKMDISDVQKITIVPILNSDSGKEYIWDAKVEYRFKTLNFDSLKCIPSCSGKNCGDDSCGGSCGKCDEDYFCDAIGRCIMDGCVPVANPCGTSECGTASNGSCGQVRCGSCTLPETCNSNNKCECVSESDYIFCTRLGKQCGNVTSNDNCGIQRKANCGTCVIPNQPNCTAESNLAFCTRFNKLCGELTANDNCGSSRTVNCGTCTPVCNAENNLIFCSRLGKQCGSVTSNDNCGNSRTVSSCGSCSNGYSCTDGICTQPANCVSESNSAFCSRLGKQCGSVTSNDNCGNSRTVSSCGSCSNGYSCNSGTCTQTSSGNAYYLSPSGSDTAGDGSITKPWFTLSKAWSSVVAGDIIYLRGGTYKYNSAQILTGKSGTSSKYINIWAYPGEQPVLTKSSSYTQPNWPNGLIRLVAEYTYWKGIEISYYTQATNAGWNGMVVYQGGHNKLEMMNIHHCGGGMDIRSSEGNLLLNSDIHHNSDPLSEDSYGDSDGLAIGYIDDANSEPNIIRGCRFWWNTDDGVDLWDNEGPVIIENSWSWYNGFIPDTFTEAGNGNGFKLGKSDLNNPDIVLRTLSNCISAQNKLWGYLDNGASCNIKLDNNLAYDNCYKDLADWCGGFYFRYPGALYYMRNNIAYESGKTTADVNANSNINHNSWNLGVSVSDSDFESLSVSSLDDPRKPDGSLPDILFGHLVQSSDLIDKGIDLGFAYSGSAPDLGAFEYANN